MHGHSIPVNTRHGRPHVRLGISLRIAAWMAIAHWGHGGDVGVGVTLGHLTHGHHPLHLLLPLMLEVLELLLSELVPLLVQGLPGRVLVVLLPLGLRKELVIADHPVLISIRLFEHVLPHSLHLLLPLPHVVLRGVRVVHLVQLLLEQDPHLSLVPLAIAVEVMHHKECFGVKVLWIHVVLILPDLFKLLFGHGMVHFLVLPVFCFKFFHFLLDNFSLRSVIDSVESHLLLELFLHLIFLELLLPRLVLLLQICCCLLDQLLEVLNVKLLRPDIQMFGDLEMLLVYSLISLELLLGQVPQSLQLLPLDLIQLGPHPVAEVLQLLGDGAVPDLVHLGPLQLLPKLRIALEDLNNLLKIFVVLESKIHVLGLVLLRPLLVHWGTHNALDQGGQYKAPQ